MNDDLTKLLSFETKIKIDGSIDYPTDKLKKLRENGFEELKICIYGNSKKAAKYLEIDISLFNKIKSMQSLPDSVVLDFLKSKGSLTNFSIKKRISF